MEIVELADDNHKRHKWLEWIRLEQPPPDPDAWVPVVRALAVSDRARGTSRLGDRLVELLSRAGIEAHQRSYTWDNTSFDVASLSMGNAYALAIGKVEIHLAVLVHARDQASAIQIAVDFQKTLDHQLQAGMPSDEELTRAALEAGERLKAARLADDAAREHDTERPDRIA